MAVIEQNPTEHTVQAIHDTVTHRLIGYPKRSLRHFSPRQQDLLKKYGHEIIDTSSSSVPQIAVLRRPLLQQMQLFEAVNPDQIFDSYHTRNFGSLSEISLFIGSEFLYTHILNELELRNPGYLKKIFQVDPNGYRGLSGYNWLATSDRIHLPDHTGEQIEYVEMLSSHNGKDFTRMIRKLTDASVTVGLLPIVVPRRVLQ
ncbi:MAG: hypothetical protein M3Q44_00395 [bacterium]|nr:hypothetical protein [bacterium]